MRKIVILGSTGSIGKQTLEVIAKSVDKFSVTGICCAGNNLILFAKQAVEYRVKFLGITFDRAVELQKLIAQICVDQKIINYNPEILWGDTAATELAKLPETDIVVNAMTGSIGLKPTLAALEAGKILALANKESLIAGGNLISAAARKDQIIPIDSEHSAIAQCLKSGSFSEVNQLILTASGGPFWGHSRERLADVTPEQALCHPTWNMGKMVTTNSATLVNKGLEVIEANILFDVPISDISVLVHRQSVVHSMVEFIDGSTIAQCSPPDMRLPIGLALFWPERNKKSFTVNSWSEKVSWTFEPLDNYTFPAVQLAKEAAMRGTTFPAVYNAANEEAVTAFHKGSIGFLDIVDIVRAAVESHSAETEMSLDHVFYAEFWARNFVKNYLVKGK